MFLTFVPDYNEEPISQVALAHKMGRTKQALSHQLLLMVDKVKEVTGARAGFRRTRNLRSRRKKRANLTR